MSIMERVYVGTTERRTADNVACIVGNDLRWNVYYEVIGDTGLIQFRALGRKGTANIPARFFDGSETEERLAHAVKSIMKSTEYKREEGLIA